MNLTSIEWCESDVDFPPVMAWRTDGLHIEPVLFGITKVVVVFLRPRTAINARESVWPGNPLQANIIVDSLSSLHVGRITVPMEANAALPIPVPLTLMCGGHLGERLWGMPPALDGWGHSFPCPTDENAPRLEAVRRESIAASGIYAEGRSRLPYLAAPTPLQTIINLRLIRLRAQAEPRSGRLECSTGASHSLQYTTQGDITPLDRMAL